MRCCDDDNAPQPEHDCGLGADARAIADLLGIDPDEGDFDDIWENLTKDG